MTIDSISNTFSKIKNYQFSTQLVCWLTRYRLFMNVAFGLHFEKVRQL